MKCLLGQCLAFVAPWLGGDSLNEYAKGFPSVLFDVLDPIAPTSITTPFSSSATYFISLLPLLLLLCFCSVHDLSHNLYILSLPFTDHSSPPPRFIICFNFFISRVPSMRKIHISGADRFWCVTHCFIAMRGGRGYSLQKRGLNLPKYY